MSRNLDPFVAAALRGSNVPMLLLVEFDFQSGIRRLCNVGMTVEWNGHTWEGGATLGRVESIKEGATLEAHGVTFDLSAVASDILSTILTEDYQGRTVRVWLAPLSATYQPIADPALVYVGRMDSSTVSMGAEAAISLSTESRLIDLDRARVRRFNSEDQQIDAPGDKGFDFVPGLVEKSIKWGVA